MTSGRVAFAIDVAKVLLSFMQVLGVLNKVQIDWPADYKTVLKWFSFFGTVEVPGTACLLEHISFYDKLLMLTVGPFAILLAMCLPYLYAKLRRHPNEQEILTHLMQSAIFLLLFLYPVVSAQVFSLFNCHDLNADGAFLAADYRTKCTSDRFVDDEYNRWQIFGAVAIFIWPVGLPIALLLLLLVYRVPQLARQKLALAEERAFMLWCMGRLVAKQLPIPAGLHEYERISELNYDQLTSLARIKLEMPASADATALESAEEETEHACKASKEAWASHESNRVTDEPGASAASTAQQSEATQLRSDLINSLKGMKRDGLLAVQTPVWDPTSADIREQRALEHLGVLIHPYTPTNWYFEVVEMLRKLVLISVIYVISESASVYLWASFLVSFFAHILTTTMRPYSDPRVNRIQMYSLIATCLTVFYGILLDNPKVLLAETDDEFDSAAHSLQGGVLAVLNCSIFLWPLFELLLNHLPDLPSCLG
jgi:hypothetical protein